MSSAFRRTLPARPDLEQQKKQAKELLRAFRAGDATRSPACAPSCRTSARSTLADAQFVLAREYGFANWRELKEHIEQRAAERRAADRAVQAAPFSDGDAMRCARCSSEHADVRAQLNAPIFAFDSPALVRRPTSTSTLVDVLLEFGADPNRRSDWWAGGFHPLHVVRGAAAERLLAAGAVPDACAAANLDRARPAAPR